MHVNQHDGLTIAVSRRNSSPASRAAPCLATTHERPRARARGSSPLDSAQVRRFFATRGLTLREWDKTRTDMLTIEESNLQVPAQPAQPR